MLNVSLLYHTLYQTSARTKIDQDKRKEEKKEANKEPEEEEDPDQLTLNTFLKSKLVHTNSKVNPKGLFSLIQGLHEANPLSVAPNQASLASCLTETCAFGSRNEDGQEDRRRRERDALNSKLVAFQPKKLDQVQKTALNSLKTLDQRFGSLEAIAKTRKMIQDGTLPEDEVIEESKESVEEEKKNEPGADKDEEKMIVTGESKDDGTKKVVKNDSKVQIEKVGRLVEYLR